MAQGEVDLSQLSEEEQIALAMQMSLAVRNGHVSFFVLLNNEFVARAMPVQ